MSQTCSRVQERIFLHYVDPGFVHLYNDRYQRAFLKSELWFSGSILKVHDKNLVFHQTASIRGVRNVKHSRHMRGNAHGRSKFKTT